MWSGRPPSWRQRPRRHDDGPGSGWEQALHEEINRLPERYRVAIVLCDLEGHTCEEAARRIGRAGRNGQVLARPGAGTAAAAADPLRSGALVRTRSGARGRRRAGNDAGTGSGGGGPVPSRIV